MSFLKTLLWLFILLPLIGIGLLIPVFNLLVLKKAIEIL